MLLYGVHMFLGVCMPLGVYRKKYIDLTVYAIFHPIDKNVGGALALGLMKVRLKIVYKLSHE